MKKKILVTVLLVAIIMLTSISTTKAANKDVGGAFTVDVPSEYKYTTYDDSSIYIHNYGLGETISITSAYFPNNEIVYNQSDANEYANDFAEYGVKILSKKEITLNGCKGIYLKLYYDSYKSYDDMYYLSSDNYVYMITVIANSSNLSNSTSKIVNSFKIKDTVLYTRGIPFIDVADSSPYFNAIKFNNNKKMIHGTTDNTFNPDGNLTRGQIVTILHRIEGLPKANSNAKKFKDVTGGYYYDAVMWASSNKIVNGYENGNFGPDNNVTREQLATFLKNYADYKKVNTSKREDLKKFKDYNRVESVFKDTVSWAVAEGIIKGSENYTKINPKGYATRAQAAAMLESFYSLVK